MFHQMVKVARHIFKPVPFRRHQQRAGPSVSPEQVLAPLFQGEVLRAAAAAAQAEADRTQREEAAAQTIQGQQTAAPAQTEETVQPTEAVQAAPTPSPAGAEPQN